jgi:hypothetical protein
VQIDDEAQVQPQTTDDSHVGCVGHLLGVRLIGCKVAGQAILDVVGPRVGQLAAVFFLARDALDLIFPHEPGNPIQAALFALLTQAFTETTGTQYTVTLGMQHADAFQQALIPSCTSAHRTITPAVVAAR